jgi:hypothetical protein
LSIIRTESYAKLSAPDVPIEPIENWKLQTLENSEPIAVPNNLESNWYAECNIWEASERRKNREPKPFAAELFSLSVSFCTIAIQTPFITLK